MLLSKKCIRVEYRHRSEDNCNTECEYEEVVWREEQQVRRLVIAALPVRSTTKCPRELIRAEPQVLWIYTWIHPCKNQRTGSQQAETSD